MKETALRKHSLHAKTAASVLLKLFISGNKRRYTTEARSGTLFSNINNIHSIIPDEKSISLQNKRKYVFNKNKKNLLKTIKSIKKNANVTVILPY